MSLMILSLRSILVFFFQEECWRLMAANGWMDGCNWERWRVRVRVWVFWERVNTDWQICLILLRHYGDDDKDYEDDEEKECLGYFDRIMSDWILTIAAFALLLSPKQLPRTSRTVGYVVGRSAGMPHDIRLKLSQRIGNQWIILSYCSVCRRH